MPREVNDDLELISCWNGRDMASFLPEQLSDALYTYAEESDYKPETIVAEALRAYLGDAA